MILQVVFGTLLVILFTNLHELNAAPRPKPSRNEEYDISRDISPVKKTAQGKIGNAFGYRTLDDLFKNKVIASRSEVTDDDETTKDDEDTKDDEYTEDDEDSENDTEDDEHARNNGDTKDCQKNQNDDADYDDDDDEDDDKDYDENDRAETTNDFYQEYEKSDGKAEKKSVENEKNETTDVEEKPKDVEELKSSSNGEDKLKTAESIIALNDVDLGEKLLPAIKKALNRWLSS